MRPRTMSAHPVPTELQQSVENAYRVFRRYRFSGAVTVCRCSMCVAEPVARELQETPLRDMSASLLAEYTNSAHEWDDFVANEFRYFLPRYFDLIAACDVPSSIGVECSLQRLSVARYRGHWPADEGEAVDAWFAALLRERLARPVAADPFGFPTHVERDTAETVLCIAAYAGADVAALLRTWDEDRGREASLHLASIIVRADWSKRRLENSWWLFKSRPDVRETMREVMAWLLRAETAERLEAACVAEADDAAASLLSRAEGMVRG